MTAVKIEPQPESYESTPITRPLAPTDICSKLYRQIGGNWRLK